MFFQSTAEGYVCPILDTRKKQPQVITQCLKIVKKEKLFLQMTAAAAFVLVVVIFGTSLWLGKIGSSIDESMARVEQERKVLTDKNIALRVEKTYLFSSQYIHKAAAEKLGMSTPQARQIKYLN